MAAQARILVTGATGKVGQVFIERLLADERFGHFRVRALCHNRRLQESRRLEVVRSSIEEKEVVNS
ncbi:MAG: NmrA family NAD(P)-binding protein, partial [Caldilineaceae bacterium]|nr:NmrA family NAD(P)-binding protein [Caldilineaceae bacterium]